MDSDNEEQLFSAMKCEASACLTKDIDPTDLVNIVRKVAQGAYPISEGLLSIGFFADGTYGNYSVDKPYVTGLFYGGGGGQLLDQFISALVVVAWAFVMGYLTFKLSDKWFGIRVPPEEELQGLDIPEHGTPAYPDFVTTRT